MIKLKKVISGGQTGVDQAALSAAQACGVLVGGWCPPGRTCDSGPIPSEFPLQETPQERSPDAPDVARSLRTQWNVRDSDATLILRPAQADDPGTDWAVRCVTQSAQPFLECDPTDPKAFAVITKWLQTLPIQTLNVAGPSERCVPGIGTQTLSLLKRIFADLH